MKKPVLFLLLALLDIGATAQTKQQIDNETTFAKLYGYVRYFHPSDEAAAIDWDKFAICGAKKVEACRNTNELKAALFSLFTPIAPTLQLADEKQAIVFDKSQLIPPITKGYDTIAWQHVGVGLVQDKDAPYQSARTHRKIIYVPVSNKSVAIAKIIDVTAYRNMPLRLKVKSRWLHGNGKGYFGLLVVNNDKTTGFKNNTSDHPVETTNWQNLEIDGIIDSTATKLWIEGWILGNGELDMDDFDVAVKTDDKWVNIYTNTFNAKATGEASTGLLSDIPFKLNADYSFNIVEDKNSPGEKWASIKSRESDSVVVDHTEFFKYRPGVGEYISKNISSGLKIMLPVALYGDSLHSYPAADGMQFSQLRSQLNAIKNSTLTGDSLYTRLADVIISWNVFQHFFPYFDYAKTDWEQDMQNALTDAYTGNNGNEFLKTLQKFTAKLRDGHIGVYKTAGYKQTYLAPITWEWIEGKLVITNVLKPDIKLNKGTIVTSINGLSPEEYFKNIEQYISAATPGWLSYRAQTESLLGEKDSELKLTTLSSRNTPGQITIKRNLSNNAYNQALPDQDSIKKISGNIMYLNLGTISMSTINKAMPQLKNSKAIICDMRGNTTDNYSVNDFIENLIAQKDTASHWLKIPQMVYPDQEKIIGYNQDGFDMTPRKPHITAKIIFLIDGSDISWAESYMSIIEHYKLATIIGQPTAGTNGDTNCLNLPGDYSIYFTGTKTVKLDGSQHHGVGTKPDIYVEKTIKGIRENKDEFLEKAIEVANN